MRAAAASTTGNDVYVYEAEPLEEGVRKHTISVFVADEAGIINRVAGVFARRGANIESLAVGLNADRALFTIVVTGADSAVANLVKQLSKLVKVRYVEDLVGYDRVERELMLIKVNAPPGLPRTEVLQLSEIFRSRVVDVSDRSLTLVVTGDAGKLLVFQQAMSKFGVEELARTGKIALKRGEQLLEDAVKGETDAMQKSLQRKQSFRMPAVGAAPARGPGGADVYAVEDDFKGVWEVTNVLDAAYNPDGTSGEQDGFEAHTLSIEVQDIPGVLNQVTGVFARRGYNVQSLAVGNSEREGMSRICLLVPGTQAAISNLIKQLNKLVFVQKVSDLTDSPVVTRELMLIKVRSAPGQRGELRDLAEVFHGNVCDVSLTTLTMEVNGKEDKMMALQRLLEPYGVLEVARTGRVALSRDSGIDTRYLEQMKGTRVML